MQNTRNSASGPDTAADLGGHGAQLEALALAVANLLAAGLAAQAKPLADELAALIKRARGPLAEVIPLAPSRRR